jgi:hypothetical protein
VLTPTRTPSVLRATTTVDVDPCVARAAPPSSSTSVDG